MKLTVVIADDERRSRDFLYQLLQAYCPETEVIGLVSSVDETIAMVNESHPDVLFLDVKMGDAFGFDIFPLLQKPHPYVVIVSAHEEYAIKALRAQAVDYILKPVISDELKAAVKKIIERKAATSIQTGNRNNTSAFVVSTENKITIPSAEGLIFMKASDIIRCHASGSYTEIYLKDGSKLLTSINLGEFEKLLPEQWGFFRIHHSSLVNLAEVKMYVKAGSGSVIMSDNKKVPISQRKKSLFMVAIKAYLQS